MTPDMAEFGTAVLQEGTPDRPAFPQPSSKVSPSPRVVASPLLTSGGAPGQKSLKKIHTENLQKAVALSPPVCVQFSPSRRAHAISHVSPSPAQSQKSPQSSNDQPINPVKKTCPLPPLPPPRTSLLPLRLRLLRLRLPSLPRRPFPPTTLPSPMSLLRPRLCTSASSTPPSRRRCSSRSLT